MILIKKISKQVLECLKNYPETRDSDIELTIRIWREFYGEKISVEDTIHLKELFNLPREDHIKRIRAKIQNEHHLYLPTSWEVARQRGIAEQDWRAAMDNPGVIDLR